MSCQIRSNAKRKKEIPSDRGLTARWFFFRESKCGLSIVFFSSRSIALPGVYQRRRRRLRRRRQRQEPQPEQPGGGGGEEDEEAEAELERKEERHHEEHKQDQEQALKVNGGEEAIATLYCILQLIVASNMRLRKQISFFSCFASGNACFFHFWIVLYPGPVS